MVQRSARVNATPSKAASSCEPTQEVAAVLKATNSTLQARDFKYIDDFGFRKLGDPLMDFRHNSEMWSTLQDVELILFCEAERGHLIAYAEIKVDQSSTDHEARVIGGGIGMDRIRILIKANSTYWLRYETRIYGSQPLAVGEGQRIGCTKEKRQTTY